MLNGIEKDMGAEDGAWARALYTLKVAPEDDEGEGGGSKTATKSKKSPSAPMRRRRRRSSSGGGDDDEEEEEEDQEVSWSMRERDRVGYVEVTHFAFALINPHYRRRNGKSPR